MSPFTLENQRVVIIGGSSGIGLATAIQAAEAGAHVVIAGRSEIRLEEAREQIAHVAGKGKTGAVSVEVHVLDNQDEQQIEQCFNQVGEFDHLFTPGAAYTRGPLASDLGDGRELLQGQVLATVLCSQIRGSVSVGFGLDYINVWGLQSAPAGWWCFLRCV